MKGGWALVALAAMGCRKVERAAPPQAPAAGPTARARPAHGPRRIDGPAALVAQKQSLPVALALDPDNIYWANYGRDGIASGSVMKLARSGGAPEVLADFETQPAALAVDDEFVYWAAAGAIRRIAKAGGSIVNLDRARPGSAVRRRGLAVGPRQIFFCDPQAGTIWRLAKAGGAPEVLASGQAHPLEIALDGGDVYWLNQGGDAGPSGAVMRWRAGTTSVVAAGLGIPRALLLDGDDLFVIQEVPDAPHSLVNAPGIPELMRIDKAGGAAQVLVHGQDVTAPLAVDASHIYFTMRTGWLAEASVNRMPRRGGSLEVLARPGLWVGALAVNPNAVYFTGNRLTHVNDGSIGRVPLAGP